MSPKVLQVKDLIFWFHSHDARNEDRPSVHVGKNSQDDFNDAKIWLEPMMEIAREGYSLRAYELSRALKIIHAERQFLLEEWHGYRKRAR